MVDPAQKDATGFYLPASALEQLLPALWPGRFPAVTTSGPPLPLADEFAARGGTGPPDGADGGGVREMPGDIERVDVWAEPDRTRLGFRLARTPGVVVDDSRRGTLTLQLAGVDLPAAMAAGLSGVGLVDSAGITALDGGTALTLWLDPAVSVYAVSPLRQPAGVEVVLRSGAPDEAAILLAADVGIGRGLSWAERAREEPSPEAAAPSSMAGGGELVTASDRPGGAGPALEASAPGPEPPVRRSGWTIVLDAGHGGHDPGAIGPGGTREKVVTLAVTRALAERLEEVDGLNVILTRDGDEFIALGERTKLANRKGADLFVSIHANSASRAAEGFETYFLSAAKTEDARRVARMENSAIRYEDSEIDPESLDELNFILRDLAQNEYLRESSALAETIQEELNRRLPLKSRGVKQAGFFVLNGAFMPAILFEMAFISNPREESLLNDRAFQTRIVDGLADGVLAFLDQYGRKVVASRAAR
ncbi:N-acetylmuramoyl-L-alanine amidase [soil metagenome]